MHHILMISHWTPTPLNKLMRNRWVCYRHKKRDLEMVWGCALQERIPVAKGKRRVEMLVMLKPSTRRKPDPDSLFKSTLDALVGSRMLIDDSDKWCEWTMPKLEKGTKEVWGTRLVLTDIE